MLHNLQSVLLNYGVRNLQTSNAKKEVQDESAFKTKVELLKYEYKILLWTRNSILKIVD